MTSITGNSTFSTSITANGGGAKVNLSNLTTLSGALDGNVVQVQDFHGGLIDMSKLAQMVNGAVQWRAFDATSVIDLSALVTFAPTTRNATLEAHSGGSLRLTNATLTVSNAGIFLDSGGTMTAGTLSLTTGAVLTGSGTLAANLVNGGLVQFAGSVGSLTIAGNYTQTAAGSLNIRTGGLTAGTQFDQLNIMGTASFGGTLNLTVVGGFTPAAGNVFKIVTVASRTGQFATVNGTSLPGGRMFVVGYDPADITLTVA